MIRKSFESGPNQSGELFHYKPVKRKKTEQFPKDTQSLRKYLETLPPKSPKERLLDRTGQRQDE